MMRGAGLRALRPPAGLPSGGMPGVFMLLSAAGLLLLLGL